MGPKLNLSNVLSACKDADDLSAILCIPPWSKNSPSALVPIEIYDAVVDFAPQIAFAELFALRHHFGDGVFDDLNDGAIDRIVNFAINDA